MSDRSIAHICAQIALGVFTYGAFQEVLLTLAFGVFLAIYTWHIASVAQRER